jgi:dipeptidyl aminopeptidase/acylaminoacyl peptidase
MKQAYLIFFTFFYIGICVHAQELPPFQSMDVFSLEWVDDPQISPDGTKVVYVRRGMDVMTDKRISRLWIINTDGSEHYKLTSQDVNESNPRWSPDGSRIAFTSSTVNGSELFVYWTKTSRIARLSSLESSPRAISWSPNGNQLAFTMFVAGKEMSLVSPLRKPKGASWASPPRVTTRLKHEADGTGKLKPGYPHLFVLPSNGGVPRQLTDGNYNLGGTPSWHPNGQDIIFSSNRNEGWEYDFRNSELYAVNIYSSTIRELTNRQGPDNNLSVSKNGEIAYLGFDDKKQTYQLTNLYTKSIEGTPRKVNVNLDRSIQSPTWSDDGKVIYFMYDDKGNTKIAKTTTSGKVTKLADNVGGTSIGRPYGGGSFSVSSDGIIAYTHTTPYHPAELAIIDKKGNTQFVMSLNDDILPYRELAKVEEIWYKSSVDGRDIQGWVAYPPGYDSSKQYPMMVENHGGPISNYGDRFSPEIQLLAAGGYIVFYPNPRGSTSYGEEFGNLLYHNYPGDDYHDVMDGVDALISKGLAHENKLYVTGGSAGGIMSAWMIGKNNRFEAAAVIKPVMNWVSKTLTADNYYAYANTRYPGQPWENPDIYWKYSPISLVGNIETPTLVMVGGSDLRTPLSEAKQLYHALKIRKIPTVLVEMPGAFHFIANRPSQLISKIEHILAWFELYQN